MKKVEEFDTALSDQRWTCSHEQDKSSRLIDYLEERVKQQDLLIKNIEEDLKLRKIIYY